MRELDQEEVVVENVHLRKYALCNAFTV